jgi:hypothetical protein
VVQLAEKVASLILSGSEARSCSIYRHGNCFFLISAGPSDQAAIRTPFIAGPPRHVMSGNLKLVTESKKLYLWPLKKVDDLEVTARVFTEAWHLRSWCKQTRLSACRRGYVIGILAFFNWQAVKAYSQRFGTLEEHLVNGS